MPELPEVEIVRRNLERWWAGRRITAIEVLRSSIIRGQDPSLVGALVGTRVVKLHRRGKALWLETEGPLGCVLRLGMTGKWILQSGSTLPAHTRVRVQVDGQKPVCLVDMRAFGSMEVVASSEGLMRLKEEIPGVDPILEVLTPGRLREALHGTRAPIKVALLDQRRVAGVGNIYASEALFRARIDPRVPASGLDDSACARLSAALVAELEVAIKREDGEEVVYFGEGKGMKNPFNVYQRTGEPCVCCGESIVREVLSGRSTFFCKNCQRSGACVQECRSGSG